MAIDLSLFTHTPEMRAEITEGLTPRQAHLVNLWIDEQETINRGDWEGMDTFFDTEKMTYDNPNRPDLGTYKVWKTSPQALYKTFPPCVYRTVKAWGRGDDEICVLCNHQGEQTGGNYMGVPPKGQKINVWWFSWVRFEGDKIVHIYSVADVLTMFKDVGVIDVPQPVDPYK